MISSEPSSRTSLSPLWKRSSYLSSPKVLKKSSNRNTSNKKHTEKKHIKSLKKKHMLKKTRKITNKPFSWLTSSAKETKLRRPEAQRRNVGVVPWNSWRFGPRNGPCRSPLGFAVEPGLVYPIFFDAPKNKSASFMFVLMLIYVF